MSDGGDTEGGLAAAKKLNISIANSLPEIATVTDALDQFTQTLGLPETVTWRVHLALEELLRNVITHAFSDNTEHAIEVDITCTDYHLIATIIDDGIPFNPLNAKPPDLSDALEDREVGGLGVHLARNVVDAIDYEWRMEKNIVTVRTKLLQGDNVR